jgi:sulfur carrier protein
MIVELNGDRTDVASGTHVGTLVDGVAPSRKGVAVAVNGDIVPRSAWDGTGLSEGDRVEVLGAAQGG